MPIYIYIFLIFIFFVFIYYIFLKYVEKKINIQEKKIKKLFIRRTSIIPSIFEISKDSLTKHNDIFYEILKLRKIEFTESNNHLEINEIMNTEKLVNHEMNFIFKVSNKHPKLIKEGKFIYLRNIVIKNTKNIDKNIKNYKKSIKKFNRLIEYKNFTIIGILFYIGYKSEI